MVSFYVGKYLVEQDLPIDRSWTVPIDSTLEALKETSNVEDLMADPEDFDLFPLEVQTGSEQWELDTVGSDSFSISNIRDSNFYAFYYGEIGRGFHIKEEAIAISDFYLFAIESGYIAGSRIKLEFV